MYRRLIESVPHINGVNSSQKGRVSSCNHEPAAGLTNWCGAMSKKLSPARPAMTAIAAVIALSSTTAFAQTTDTSAVPAAPVVVAPPPPVVTAPPAAAQTAAPETVAPAPVEAAPIAAPAPAMKTVGTPVVHDADTSTASASVATAAPTRSTPAKRVSATTASRASRPVATTSVAPAKAESAPAPLPAPVAKTVPTAAETAAATPAAAPAPLATATQTTHATSLDDEALPIAGGVGLAVLALGGAVAYGVSRRRRERKEDELLLEPTQAAAVAVPEAETLTPVTEIKPVRGRMPKTLPNGFDISRFGRHTQAAYLGPTEDNPSFSLKRRLKRASFFDQREREAAETKLEQKAAKVEAPATAAVPAKQNVADDGQITIRLAPQRKRNGGYILQR